MKKFALLILVLFFVAMQSAFATPQTSDNSFEIMIDQVPPGSTPGGSKSSGGLSDGVVTAITLGSVFGGIAALGGLGWYFSHKIGLACGCVFGSESPYSTIVIDDCSILEKLCGCKNKYLLKAFEFIKPEKNSSKRYLLVQDMTIKSKTYNTIFFDLPDKKFKNVKIVQISEPFKMKNNLSLLDTKIILNPKAFYELPTTIAKNDSESGILIKKGIIEDNDNKTAALVTENKMQSLKNYAIIVEFSE